MSTIKHTEQSVVDEFILRSIALTEVASAPVKERPVSKKQRIIGRIADKLTTRSRETAPVATLKAVANTEPEVKAVEYAVLDDWFNPEVDPDSISPDVRSETHLGGGHALVDDELESAWPQELFAAEATGIMQPAESDSALETLFVTEGGEASELLPAQPLLTEIELQAEVTGFIEQVLLSELFFDEATGEPLYTELTPEQVELVRPQIAEMLDAARQIEQMMTFSDNPEQIAELQVRLEALAAEILEALGWPKDEKAIRHLVIRIQQIVEREASKRYALTDQGTHEIKLDTFPGRGIVATLFQIFDVHALIGRAALMPKQEPSVAP